MIQRVSLVFVFILVTHESTSFILQAKGNRAKNRIQGIQMIKGPIDYYEDVKSFEILKRDHPLSPPNYLKELKMNESITPIPSLPDLSVTRVCRNPDIFLFRNLLSQNQVDKIMKYASNTNMDYSGTKSGDVVHQRMNSYSCWVRETEDELKVSPAHSIAQYMSEISSIIFVSDIMKDLEENVDDIVPRLGYDAEPLQVVKYEVGGKFDVHHDGYSRFLTVLTYLNGVAGTWFPFALVDESELCSEQFDESEIPDMRSNEVANGKRPGKDGLVIVSRNDASYKEYPGTGIDHVVRVNQGDAVAFYNYDWIVRLQEGVEDEVPATGPIMNWRAIHSGLCAEKEKWIATNWFRFMT